MYSVKLKTGLSPSADDHSISELQKKRGTYAFDLLKNTEPVTESCTVCTGYTRAVSNMGVAKVIGNARSSECQVEL